jgi:hypothetical protein
MNHRLPVVLSIAIACSLGGCVVYDTYPYSQPTMQQRFDRSWSAASGAMVDEGVSVTSEDRGAGVIRGTRGSVAVVASVRTLADGRIEVKFDATAPSGGDSELATRIYQSYERRMGR